MNDSRVRRVAPGRTMQRLVRKPRVFRNRQSLLSVTGDTALGVRSSLEIQ